jgi:hypothetical protein
LTRKPAPVLIVPIDSNVEELITQNRIVCHCGGGLARWGWSTGRRVRGLIGLIVPRRVRCRSCERTHVLLPSSLLFKRADSVERIGRGLELAAGGVGFRKVALVLKVPPETARGWVRSALRNVGALVATFTGFLRSADPTAPTVLYKSGLPAVIDIAGRTVAALARKSGPNSVSRLAFWQVVCVLTVGNLLAPGSGSWKSTRTAPYA